MKGVAKVRTPRYRNHEGGRYWVAFIAEKVEKYDISNCMALQMEEGFTGFCGRMKFSYAVCSVFLICHIGFIQPLHHHEDGRDHPECLVCAAQDQPSEEGALFFHVVFAVFVVAEVVCQGIVRLGESHAAYNTRAPPLVF
jgi:hypothetical protein